MWVAQEGPIKVSKQFKDSYKAFKQEWLVRKSRYEIDFDMDESVQKDFPSYFAGMDELTHKGENYV